MKLYSEWEAAKKLGLSIDTIQRMCETGKLKDCCKIDDTWQIPQNNFITDQVNDTMPFAMAFTYLCLL